MNTAAPKQSRWQEENTCDNGPLSIGKNMYECFEQSNQPKQE